MISPGERLFEAVAAGNIAAIRELVEGDPGLASSRNEQQISIIMFALYHKQNDIVDLLLKHRPTIDLFEAAALGDSKTVRAILPAEPDQISSYSADGFSALALACYFGQSVATNVLIETGADVNAMSRNGADLCPLHGAVAGGHTEVVTLLLDAGANPNAKQRGGWTPLHGAANHGDVEQVSLLLAAGADRSLTSDGGKTARDMADAKNHAEVVALLDEA